MQEVSTCLWFANQAAEAAAFYVSVFPDSGIIATTHYLEGAPMPAGTVLTVQFRISGTEYLALNGNPAFPFSPAMSLVAYCDTQAELNRLWDALSEGGQTGQCGWLTDRYGISWQIVPRALIELIATEDRAAAQRAFSAMMGMTRLDIAAIRQAYDNG